MAGKQTTTAKAAKAQANPVTPAPSPSEIAPVTTAPEVEDNRLAELLGNGTEEAPSDGEGCPIGSTPTPEATEATKAVETPEAPPEVIPFPERLAPVASAPSIEDEPEADPLDEILGKERTFRLVGSASWGAPGVSSVRRGGTVKTRDLEAIEAIEGSGYFVEVK